MQASQHRHWFRVYVRNLGEVVLPLSVAATGWEQYTGFDDDGVYEPTQIQ